MKFIAAFENTQTQYHADNVGHAKRKAVKFFKEDYNTFQGISAIELYRFNGELVATYGGDYKLAEWTFH